MSDLVNRLRVSWDADRSIISQTDAWMRERREAAGEIEQLRNTIRFIVLGWREYDWPEGFDRRTAEMIADRVRAEIGQQ